jgi:hypothetical protein
LFVSLFCIEAKSFPCRYSEINEQEESQYNINKSPKHHHQNKMMATNTNQSNEATAVAAAVFSAPAPQSTVDRRSAATTRPAPTPPILLSRPTPGKQRTRESCKTSTSHTTNAGIILAEKTRLTTSRQLSSADAASLAPKKKQQMEHNKNKPETNGIVGGGSVALGDKRRVSETIKKNQHEPNDGEKPPMLASSKSTSTAASATTATATTTTTTLSSTVLADKRRMSEQTQNGLQQDVSSSCSSTVDGSRHRATRDVPLSPQSTTTTTTHPGAIHIHGWAARGDDDDSESESSVTHASFSSFSNLAESATGTTTLTTTRSTSLSQMIVSAQLVDEDELQRHAELLFQQMLAQAAVAELVDEDEMRQRAQDQASVEFQKQLQRRLEDEREKAAATQQDGGANSSKNNSKRQQQRRLQRITVVAFCLVVAVIVAVVVAIGMGGDRIGQRQEEHQTASNRSVVPTSAMPSFSPSMAPSAMPSAASSWRQMGSSINGVQELELFGAMLGFSADGNMVVASRETPARGQVHSYTYHNETNEWKQLGLPLTRDFAALYPDNVCLSPNGKNIVFISHPATGGSLLRIFTLRRGNETTNATTTIANDTAAAAAAANVVWWEQIGPDIVQSSDEVAGISLTDNLELAAGNFYSSADPRSDLEFLVHAYQFDANQSDWVRMGQDISSFATSLQFATHKSTGALILAVGDRLTASTFRYESSTDSWIKFGSELVGDDETSSPHDGVWLSLAANGETITVGLQNEAVGYGIGLLRTYSYDAATDDWIQLGKVLQDSSFLFSPSFCLSANGQVMVTTTQKVDRIMTGLTYVTGQVRTWDYIAGDGGVGGEWIQRGAALEVGTLKSEFGYRLALSADGNRIATSAINALNDQGVQSGKVRDFENY